VKKWLALGVLAFAALAAFAGTCTIIRVNYVEIDGKDTYGAELKNDSGADFLQHNFVVAFINSSGAVVETKTVPGCLRTLQNGKSNFFSATSTLSPSSTDVALSRLAFDSTLKVGSAETGDVTITITSITREGDELTVIGKIKNEDSDDLDDPVVCIVVRDTSSNVVKVFRDSASGDLDEDDEYSFTLTFTVPDSTTEVDEVDVHVDGLEDGVPTKPESDTGNAVTEVGDAEDLAFSVQPANTTGGTDFASDVKVKIVDEDGNTVTSADDNITLAIDTNPSAGTLTCDDTTVDAVDGVATFSDCSIDKAGTGYKLKATATGLTTATSSAFNVTVGAAAKLTFTTEPSAVATAATDFAQQPVVTVQDAGGNTVTTSVAPVTLTIAGAGPGVLTCTTNPLPAVAGVADFAGEGCEISLAGTNTIVASSGALATDTSVSIVTS